MRVKWKIWAALVAGLVGMSPAVAALSDTIAKLKPSVMMVGSYAETDNPRFTFRGTGFAVQDGRLAVTNAHVLPEPDEDGGERQLVVQVADGRGRWQQRLAHVVSTDRTRDLALISLEGSPLPPLRLAANERVREGVDIALMGFPLAGAVGFTPVTHRGIVSAITSVVQPPPVSGALSARAVRQLRAGVFDVLQLDATAYPGNSGGPAFDPDSGEVVGVISMVLVKGTRESALSSPTGITYAVPVSVLRDFLQQSLP